MVGFWPLMPFNQMISVYCGGGNATAGEPSLGLKALIAIDRCFQRSLSPDFGGQHRAKLVPPEPIGLVADLDAALV